MLRRLAALATAVAMLLAASAPALASAATRVAGVCRCASHEHCAMVNGKHVCPMAASSSGGEEGATFSACSGGLAIVLGTLPSLTAPARLAAPHAPPSARLAIERTSPPPTLATPPETPPPRA